MRRSIRRRPDRYDLVRAVGTLLLVVVAGVASLTFSGTSHAFAIDVFNTIVGEIVGAEPSGIHESITAEAVQAVSSSPPSANFIEDLQRGVQNTDITHQFDCMSHFDNSSVRPLPDPTAADVAAYWPAVDAAFIPPPGVAGWWNAKMLCGGGQGFHAGWDQLWQRLNKAIEQASGNPEFLNPSFSSFRGIATDAVTTAGELAADPRCLFHSGCPTGDAASLVNDYTTADTISALVANPNPDPHTVDGEDSPFQDNVPAGLNCGPCGVAGDASKSYRELVTGLKTRLESLLGPHHESGCNCDRTLAAMLGSDNHEVQGLQQELNEVNAYLAFQNLGHAFHTTEDFFAHTNYIELVVDGKMGADPDSTNPLEQGVLPGHSIADATGCGAGAATCVHPDDFRSLVPQTFDQFTWTGMQSYLNGIGGKFDALQSGAVYASWLGEGDWCTSEADELFNSTSTLSVNGILYQAGTNPKPPFGFKYCHYNSAVFPNVISGNTGLNKDEPDKTDVEPEHVNHDYARAAARKMAEELYTYFRRRIGPVTKATESRGTGPNGIRVTVHLTATDTSGQNIGIQQIEYSADGAQPIQDTVVQGSSVDIPIDAAGTTTIHFHATDQQHNTEPDKTYAVQIVDQPANPGYTYDVIAKTGDAATFTTASGQTFNDQFTTFDAFPSINDLGTVVFSGYHQGPNSNGTGLWVKVGGEDVRNINPQFSQNPSRVFETPVITMTNDVIATDRVAGAPPSFRVRLWDARLRVIDHYTDVASSTSSSSSSGGVIFNPGTDVYSPLTTAGLAGYGVGDLPSFSLAGGSGGADTGYEYVVNPALNDSGSYAYVGGSGDTVSVGGPGGSGQQVDGPIRPMLTDSGDLIWRAGGKTDYNAQDNTPPSPIEVGDSPLACYSGCRFEGFKELGAAPGASGDASIVVFEGDYEGPNTGAWGAGPGIFAAIRHAGDWDLERVARIGDADITRFDTWNRVAVQSTANAERAATILFTAYGPMDARGFYVAKLRFGGQSDGTFDFANASISVEAPKLLVAEGSQIPGVGAIGDLDYGLAPLNDHGAGEVSFWIKTSSGEAVVRARPKCDGSYAPGTEKDSTYINAYDAGPNWNLPLSATAGVSGGNACGPASTAMAWNLVKHAHGKAQDGAMADLAAFYGTGLAGSGTMLKLLPNGTFGNGVIHDRDRAGWSAIKAQAFLASDGWVSTVGYGKDFVDQQLDAGNLVVGSTTFGVGAQPVPAAASYGSGHILLYRGKTPNGDYIVDDAAGDFYSDPTHGGLGAHYGPGICGEGVVYPKEAIERNSVLRNANGDPVAVNGQTMPFDSAQGRQALSISYHQDADPEVLLVEGFFSGSNGRPYNLSLQDSAGNVTGFTANGQSAGIPNSFAAIDMATPDDPMEDASQSVDPRNYPDALTVVNPGNDLKLSVDGTQDGTYTVEFIRIQGGEVVSDDTITGTVSAGDSKTVKVTHEPTATPVTTTVVQDSFRAIQLAGADQDGNPLTFAIASPPAHGTLGPVGSDGKVTYTADAGYLGKDSFTYVSDNGTFQSKPAKVSITVKVNSPPVVAIQPVAAAAEGAPVTVTAAATDEDDDPMTYAWTTDNGTIVPSADGTTATWTPADGPDTASVTVTVSDTHGGATPATKKVTVANVAPTATFANDGPVDEVSPFHLSVSNAADASAADQAAGFTFAFDCGDGAGYGLFGTATSATCPTSDSAVRSVGLKVKDRDGGVREYRDTVTVRDVPPKVTTTPTSATQYWGLPVSLSGSATDVAAADQAAGFQYSWSFGDGGTAAGPSATHVYAAAGTYTATLSATDKDGGVGKGGTAVTVNKRGSSVAYTGQTSAPYGFATLSAQLRDTVDAGSAQLAGHRIVFIVGTQSFVGTTDGSGVATVVPSPIAPGSYPVTVSFGGDGAYNASSTRGSLSITSTLGSITATGLVPASGGTASLTVTNTGAISGTLDYTNLTTTLHAVQLGPLGIRTDGHAAWLAGVDTLGRKITVYLEDNGPGSADVFKLTVNGVAQTTGPLSAGDVSIVRSG